MHLSADYWVDKAVQPGKVQMDEDEIAAFNHHAFASDPNMVDLASYPEKMSGEGIAGIVRSISKPYHHDLYYRDGRKMGPADYERYTSSLNIDELPNVVSVRFGMVLQRADMRTWPTQDIVFKSQDTLYLDRFQENGLFPAEVVAVLHESADSLWYFVQSYNYAAWVRQDKIVTGHRPEIIRYRNSPRFLVVTGSKATTNFNPHLPTISELQLEMGVRLPLTEPDEMYCIADGQDPDASHAVQLPVCNDRGELAFRTALIARSEDVRHGFLPYTHENIIQQAFKFLGERYGWGHSYNARDCTGLVSEVYKTVGIFLPRNSAQQGHSPIGANIHVSPDDTAEQKLNAIASAEVGDLLYSAGHVMMYLGSVDGQPYVIHDSSGSGSVDEVGKYKKGVQNGVSVTSLTPMYASQDFTHVDKLYAIKKIR